MKSPWVLVIPACVLASLCMADAQSQGKADPAKADPAKALLVIGKALQSDASAADDRARRKLYSDAISETLPLVTDNVMVTDVFKSAKGEAAKIDQDREAARVLRVALTEARDTLAFKPLMEAKLPEGFPQPTPVGVIQVKKYPAYRLARASMKGSEGVAFWTLFAHITKNDIAMTAPVEMTYGRKPGDAASRDSMAFLYGSTKIGKTGKDLGVEVVDMPAMTAVSIGLRGESKETAIGAARKRLEGWLKDHPEYTSAGPIRVMGYNSPMVANNKRYVEVQIPIRKSK